MEWKISGKSKFILLGMIVLSVLCIIACSNGHESNPFANQTYDEENDQGNDDSQYLLGLLGLIGSGSEDEDSSFLGKLITSPSFPPVTVIPQFIPYYDTDTEPDGSKYGGAAAPGMANIWDLISDFELADGGDDQWDGALLLTVGATDFPADQTQSELSSILRSWEQRMEL